MAWLSSLLLTIAVCALQRTWCYLSYMKVLTSEGPMDKKTKRLV